MLSHPKNGHKSGLFLLTFLLLITLIYNWIVQKDFRISTNNFVMVKIERGYGLIETVKKKIFIDVKNTNLR